MVGGGDRRDTKKHISCFLGPSTSRVSFCDADNFLREPSRHANCHFRRQDARVPNSCTLLSEAQVGRGNVYLTCESSTSPPAVGSFTTGAAISRLPRALPVPSSTCSGLMWLQTHLRRRPSCLVVSPLAIHRGRRHSSNDRLCFVKFRDFLALSEFDTCFTWVKYGPNTNVHEHTPTKFPCSLEMSNLLKYFPNVEHTLWIMFLFMCCGLSLSV